MSIKSDLKSWLRGCSRLIILGIGNPLRGDDSLGLRIANNLRGKTPKNVKVIYGGITPENFVGKIKRFKPSHVLMIDAAHFGGKPGEPRLIPPENTSGIALSTHVMPLYILAWLIQKETSAKVILLGIEPKNLNLGEEISPEVEESIKQCSEMLIEVINKNG